MTRSDDHDEADLEAHAVHGRFGHVEPQAETGLPPASADEHRDGAPSVPPRRPGEPRARAEMTPPKSPSQHAAGMPFSLLTRAMARGALFGFTLVVVVLLAGSAFAGPPILKKGGGVWLLQAKLSPPRASTVRRPQGVALTLSVFEGLGEHPVLDPNNAVAALEILLPKGMTVNYRYLPQCSYAALARLGPPACPHGSQVARGYLTYDFRPVIPELFRANARVFTGRDAKGRPALLTWGKTDFGASGTLPLKMLPARGGYGPGFRADFGVQTETVGALNLVGADLTFPDRTVPLRGKRIHLLGAPTVCHGAWRFAEVQILAHKTRSVTDEQPCVS